jgi:4-phosphopantoate--beta-alanine ligase
MHRISKVIPRHAPPSHLIPRGHMRHAPPSHRIPKDHPRYISLKIRQRMVAGLASGLAAPEGLLAHGRGEAFDYLLGEKTTPEARTALRAAAAALLLAERPVISVNGNVASLVPEEMIALARALPKSVIEVNLFHRNEGRIQKITRLLETFSRGKVQILGPGADARLPGLSSQRAKTFKEGMIAADVVLVPLEDGDRAEALKRAKKKVIAIDLNPMSRTARSADITIVDNIVRAMPKLVFQVNALKRAFPASLRRIASSFDNRANLDRVLGRILKGL